MQYICHDAAKYTKDKLLETNNFCQSIKKKKKLNKFLFK